MTDTQTEDSFYPASNISGDDDSNIEEFNNEEEAQGDDDEERGAVGVINVESSPGSMTAASSSRRSMQSTKASTDGSERANSRPEKAAGSTAPPPPPSPKMTSSSNNNNNNNKKAPPSSSTSSLPTKTKKNKPKKNKDFEDFEATGKWGKVSRKEMYLVGVVAVAIVIAIVVVVIVFVTGKNQASQQQPNSSNTTFVEPIVYPTLSPQEQLDLIRAAVADNVVTASLASAIPTTVDALDAANAWVDTSGEIDPLVRAASWKVLQDTTVGAVSNRVVERFALAAVYFETKGEEWENSASWLDTKYNVCSNGNNDDDKDSAPWFGVRCDDMKDDVVAEIQLTGNNLQSTHGVPMALALLPTLTSVWLDRNALQGTVNGDIFSATNMPNMQFLYLQSNQLTGSIPTTFLSNGSDLRTIYIQGNNFTGGFPEEYCPTCATCPHPMMQFGLDCKKNPCPNEWCCDPYNHCFD